eukprot:1392913-Amorphochlora_amoeboformis.AAC.1
MSVITGLGKWSKWRLNSRWPNPRAFTPSALMKLLEHDYQMISSRAEDVSEREEMENSLRARIEGKDAEINKLTLLLNKEVLKLSYR